MRSDGVWMACEELGLDEDDQPMRVKVRPVDDFAFQRKRREIAGRNYLSVKERVRLEACALADEILLGWDNLDLPYTPQIARLVLSNPVYWRLRDAIHLSSVLVS